MDLEKGKQDEFHLHHLGKQNKESGLYLLSYRGKIRGCRIFLNRKENRTVFSIYVCLIYSSHNIKFTYPWKMIRKIKGTIP